MSGQPDRDRAHSAAREIVLTHSKEAPLGGSLYRAVVDAILEAQAREADRIFLELAGRIRTLNPSLASSFNVQGILRSAELRAQKSDARKSAAAAPTQATTKQEASSIPAKEEPR